MHSSFHKIVRLIGWALVLLTATSVFAQTQPYAPTTGTINNLVVFVRFNDQPEFSQPLSYFESLFNSAADSLKSFYLENSYNTLTINSTLYPSSSGSVTSYQDAHPTAYYQPYNAATNPIGYQGAESTAREAALVVNALNAISAQIPPGLNLDSNSDGYIDHVAFEVYSSSLNPLPVLFYSRATYDTTGGVLLNGKHLGNYTWVTAPQDVSESFPASTEIHEMGHSFGFPDLRANSGRTPVGDWDVMSLSRPVDNGAYMKYRFTHWIADIPEITSYGTYSINDLRQPTNNSYKLKLPNSSEFLILEYRKAAGPFESNLFASGLCITRVNEAAGIWGNLGGPPYFLYYFRTNGTPSNDGTGNAWDACLSAETGRTQLTDHSNPYCFRSDGNTCGIAIYAVGSTSGSSMTFSVGDPNTVPVTHPINGYLFNGGNRVSGAMVTLSGSASGVATTDSLGRYVFAVNEGGSYTITPSHANLTFMPASKTFNNVTTDQTQNFSAANNTNTISGTVTAAGIPLSGVTVSISGGNFPSPVTTDATGTYSFTVYAGSDYSVSATKSGFSLLPSSKSFANVTTDLVQNFSTPAVVTAPDAPTNVSAVGGNARAIVNFAAPVNNGGAAIIGYTVTSSPGGIAAIGVAAPIIVNGLNRGTSYTFTVTATNVAGPGAASAASNSVTPSGTGSDFNGDGNADLLWYSAATGSTAMWLMNGSDISSEVVLLTDANWKVAATADFDGDGDADVLWYNAATGSTAMWLMSGSSMSSGAGLLTDANWKVMATGDFNGDGKADLLWYNAATGSTAMWLMNGSSLSSGAVLLTDANWKVMATGDFNGDGNADLLWYNAATGSTAMWLMNGSSLLSGAVLLTDANWKVMATGDFNGDGNADLLWYNAATGSTAMWLMSGSSLLSGAVLLTDPNWKVTLTPDLNGDGTSDLLWYNAAAGQTAYWLMNGGTLTSGGIFVTDPNWKVTFASDLNGDGKSDLLWYNAATGQSAYWLMNGGIQISGGLLPMDPGWKLIDGEN